MTETYREENEINEVEMQKQKDIDLILELKKLDWALKQDGYLPTIDEAIARIARKWEVDFEGDDNDDCRECNDDLEDVSDNYPDGEII
jgi:hypothetical protein